HGTVEEGPQCPAKNRLGPYPSRQEAENAMNTAARRNQSWENDPRWHDKGDDDGDDGGKGPSAA
ncbi:hypothetical protein G3I39_13740, partial [Streptomyces fulvissimus]